MRATDYTWITDAIQYIDFNKEIFIQEACLIMYYLKGGLSKKELEEMPFREYELFLKEVIKIQEILTKEEKNG